VSIKKVTAIVQSRLGAIDWTLLTFLVLFINVKLVVKVAALLLVYVLRPKFKFGLALNNLRLPLFYIAVITIAILNVFLQGAFTQLNYLLAVLTGTAFWLMCFLATHQIKYAVEKNNTETLHNTLLLFFILNIAVSLIVYAGIIIETGAINPYRYQGNYQKYFIGTGDYIKGISFDTSTTNAVINAFGVLYFLLRNKAGWAILCMSTLLLTGSNITNLLLCATLLFVFVFNSSKYQKSIIVVCLLFLVIFLAKISPQNNTYIEKAYEKIFNSPSADKITQVKEIPIQLKPDSILSEEEKKQKIATLYIDSMSRAITEREKKLVSPVAAIAVINLTIKPEIPKPNIHTPPFQHKNDTTAFQQELIQFAKKDSTIIPATIVATNYKLPGKVMAVLQTAEFLKSHPTKILAGAGMGNFSSKLAFKTTALKIAGGYPSKYKYVHTDFEKNHLALYLNYFTKSAGQHSLINTPNSTYDQLLSEYGLLGIAAFGLLYIGFFFKQKKMLTWGMPILLLTCGLFFMEYWFEQLSVIVIFELLLFLNIKENTTAA
jgi:hypothetical protein